VVVFIFQRITVRKVLETVASLLENILFETGFFFCDVMKTVLCNNLTQDQKWSFQNLDFIDRKSAVPAWPNSQDPELTRVWVKLYSAIYHTIATWLEKVCGEILTSFWQHFDTFFCWLSFQLANQNMGTVKDSDVKLSNSPFTLLGISIWSWWQVVTVWLTIWNRSHEKLSKRCQQLIKNFPIYVGGNSKVSSTVRKQLKLTDYLLLLLKLLKQNLNLYWIIMSGKLNPCRCCHSLCFIGHPP